jgi:hypothetical protein
VVHPRYRPAGRSGGKLAEWLVHRAAQALGYILSTCRTGRSGLPRTTMAWNAWLRTEHITPGFHPVPTVDIQRSAPGRPSYPYTVRRNFNLPMVPLHVGAHSSERLPITYLPGYQRSCASFAHCFPAQHLPLGLALKLLPQCVHPSIHLPALHRFSQSS